jgi:2-polyprenyl-3-methyl-5-hydroxy-6-metoxy-1,4-benzoquinol methylase
MEIKEVQNHWLNKDHPNYERWKRAREISIDRGKFVKSIISETIEFTNLKILDIGSGEGGTSRVLCDNNFVVSIDLNKTRLLRQLSSESDFDLACGDSISLPFKNNSFDIIILQDVLEHLENRQKLIDDLHDLLCEKGIIFLSTPNKYSIINIITDPHWGVPLVSILNRDITRNYFLKYFRKSEAKRRDIAELLSLEMIMDLFNKKFEVRLFTKQAVNELFNGNKGIVWSNFHLKLLRISGRFGINKFIQKISNNDAGLVNKYFTPTFYFVIKKR